MYNESEYKKWHSRLLETYRRLKSVHDKIRHYSSLDYQWLPDRSIYKELSDAINDHNDVIVLLKDVVKQKFNLINSELGKFHARTVPLYADVRPGTRYMKFSQSNSDLVWQTVKAFHKQYDGGKPEDVELINHTNGVYIYINEFLTVRDGDYVVEFPDIQSWEVFSEEQFEKILRIDYQ
ncbi:hypothetical protein JXA27_06645 [Aerococcaceae bacterium zg-B36]|uniref:hypothetical protein n=1 Tax=Aerococcaceae bacterium zg-252 TaxID=2796928 RepID=UPI001BD8F1CC|nr:hypothetical protein [Aerococcaceae bacterium zg-B36]